jgi:hypothetical protein
MWPTLVCFCCAIDAICVIKISIFMVDGKIFAEHTCPYFLSWFSYESVSIWAFVHAMDAVMLWIWAFLSMPVMHIVLIWANLSNANDAFFY